MYTSSQHTAAKTAEVHVYKWDYELSVALKPYPLQIRFRVNFRKSLDVES
jgi:hypothetical protein